jgi:hypothetical protein
MAETHDVRERALQVQAEAVLQRHIQAVTAEAEAMQTLACALRTLDEAVLWHLLSAFWLLVSLCLWWLT